MARFTDTVDLPSAGMPDVTRSTFTRDDTFA